MKKKMEKMEAWAVRFLHPEGWTTVDVFTDKGAAVGNKMKWMEKLPHWKYKIEECRVLISFPKKHKVSK